MTRLTHTDDQGRARMVDVGPKSETARAARAAGSIVMTITAFQAIVRNELAKGDALATARLAGIMAAKRTAELIPLCHPIPLTAVEVQCTPDESLPGVRVEASAEAVSRTGVEMEAIVAVSIALATIYDMAKSADRGMRIGEIRLIAKSGGRSGDFTAE